MSRSKGNSNAYVTGARMHTRVSPNEIQTHVAVRLEPGLNACLSDLTPSSCLSDVEFARVSLQLDLKCDAWG
eukprot:2916108-Rhodomonas_salina.3